MSDETTRLIEATAGPYRGQRLTMPAADAEEAIAAGWARDPFAPPSDEPAPLPTQEETHAMLKAAEKAARKLRGEPEPDEAEAGDDDTRDMQAGEAGTYETREHRGPGRPRTRR